MTLDLLSTLQSLKSQIKIDLNKEDDQEIWVKSGEVEYFFVFKVCPKSGKLIRQQTYDHPAEYSDTEYDIVIIEANLFKNGVQYFIDWTSILAATEWINLTFNK